MRNFHNHIVTPFTINLRIFSPSTKLRNTVHNNFHYSIFHYALTSKLLCKFSSFTDSPPTIGSPLFAFPHDPETEVIPYSTAYGDAGTAAIYWVNRSQIYWGITSYTKGLMTFAGDVTTNRGGFYLLGDIEFDGSASGNIMGVTTKRGTNTATLSGFMIDAKGVSFTAPDVSSSLTY